MLMAPDLTALPLELKEMILSRVEVKQIALMGRVCRNWSYLFKSLSPWLLRQSISGKYTLEEISFLAITIISRRQNLRDDWFIAKFCRLAYRYSIHYPTPLSRKAQLVVNIGKIFNGCLNGHGIELTKSSPNSYTTFILALKTKEAKLFKEANNIGIPDAGYFLGEGIVAAKKGSLLAIDNLQTLIDLVPENIFEQDILDFLPLLIDDLPYAKFVFGRLFVRNYPEREVEGIHLIGEAALVGIPAAQVFLGECIEGNKNGAQEYAALIRKKNKNLTHIEHGQLFAQNSINHSGQNTMFVSYVSAKTQCVAFHHLALLYLTGNCVENNHQKYKKYNNKSLYYGKLKL